ncbi:MAG: hypothetical protein K1X87_05540 [Dehalococcoidia bacterium]|nr:hypothetical protein [Dehalococcoidia bacterium]
MATLTKEQALAMVGDAREARKRLAGYRETARVFSSRALIDQYPNEWVAAFDGEVVGHSKSLSELLHSLRDHGISRQDAMVRYITKGDRALIV